MAEKAKSVCLSMSCVLQVIFPCLLRRAESANTFFEKQEVMSVAITLTMVAEPQALSASLGDLCNMYDACVLVAVFCGLVMQSHD